MLVSHHPTFRRFWYPVARAADLAADRPMPFRLLGQDIVLFRGADGLPCALPDRCPHRTAKLSLGWVDQGAVVCPYHGWTFSGAGRCIRIPQRRVPEETGEISIAPFRAAERYGHVWVALEEPMLPLPEFEEDGREGWRRIDEFYEVWNTSGLRLMENSFDNAHIQFVHRDTFGDIKDPVPARYSIEETETGLVARAEIPVLNNDLQKANLQDASDRSVRRTTGIWYAPFLRKSSFAYPSGIVHSIVTAATPIDDARIQVVQWCYRNDTEAQAPAANVIAFDRRVTEEDRTVLESTDPDVPLDVGVELHMPSDRPGLIMRRVLQRLIARHEGTVRMVAAT
jgi:phenylpropionate dioxygenase-like ring-hydroxylating dioxygenase large terminal subunit